MIKKAIELAYEAQKKAIAKKTNVGCCIVTTDERYYQGANLENSYLKVYHAEEVALIRALMDGVRDHHFDYMIQIAFSKTRVYPCCLSCLAFLWEYTNPQFTIHVVYREQIIYTKSLEELVSGFGGLEHIYPYPTPPIWWGRNG
jgi:cytidine deaminase